MGCISHWRIPWFQSSENATRLLGPQASRNNPWRGRPRRMCMADSRILFWSKFHTVVISYTILKKHCSQWSWIPHLIVELNSVTFNFHTLFTVELNTTLKSIPGHQIVVDVQLSEILTMSGAIIWPSWDIANFFLRWGWVKTYCPAVSIVEIYIRNESKRLYSYSNEVIIYVNSAMFWPIAILCNQLSMLVHQAELRIIRAFRDSYPNRTPHSSDVAMKSVQFTWDPEYNPHSTPIIPFTY
jgi:hypothetical protein